MLRINGVTHSFLGCKLTCTVNAENVYRFGQKGWGGAGPPPQIHSVLYDLLVIYTWLCVCK